MEQLITPLIKDFGFPIASNIVLVAFLYKVLLFYTDKVTKMIDLLQQNTQLLNSIDDKIKEVVKHEG